MDRTQTLPTMGGLDQLHAHYGSVPQMQAPEPSLEGPDFRPGGMPTEALLPQDQWSLPSNTGACPEGPDFRSGQVAGADMAYAPQAWDQPAGTCAVPFVQSWDSMPGMDGSMRAKSMQSQTLGSMRLGGNGFAPPVASVRQAALPTQVWDSIPAEETAGNHQPMQTQAWDSVGTGTTSVHGQSLEHAALPTQGWDQMAGMTSLPGGFSSSIKSGFSSSIKGGFSSSIKSSGGTMETAMLPELPLVRKSPRYSVRVGEPVGSQVCSSQSFSQNFRGSSQRASTPPRAVTSSGISLAQEPVASSARPACQMKIELPGPEASTPPVPTRISNASACGSQMSYRVRTGGSAMVPASNDSWCLPARNYPVVGGSMQFSVRQRSQTPPMVRESTPPPAYNRDVTPSPAWRRDPTPPPSSQRDPTPTQSCIREPTPTRSYIREPTPTRSYIREPTPPPAYHQQLQATPASTPPYPLSPLVAPDGASTPRMFGRMVEPSAVQQQQQQQQQKQHMQQLQPQQQHPQSMPTCSGAFERSSSSPPLGMGGSEGSVSRSSSFLVPKGSLGPYRSAHDGGMLFRTLDKNRDGMITADEASQHQQVDDWMSSSTQCSTQHHWTQVPPGMSTVDSWSPRVPAVAARKCMTPPASCRTYPPSERRIPRARSRTRRSHESKWLLCCSNN